MCEKCAMNRVDDICCVCGTLIPEGEEWFEVAVTEYEWSDDGLRLVPGYSAGIVGACKKCQEEGVSVWGILGYFGGNLHQLILSKTAKGKSIGDKYRSLYGFEGKTTKCSFCENDIDRSWWEVAFNKQRIRGAGIEILESQPVDVRCQKCSHRVGTLLPTKLEIQHNNIVVPADAA